MLLLRPATDVMYVNVRMLLQPLLYVEYMLNAVALLWRPVTYVMYVVTCYMLNVVTVVYAVIATDDRYATVYVVLWLSV